MRVSIGPQGVYKSVDLGERKIATARKGLTDPSDADGAVFAVDVRNNKATVYRLVAEGLYVRSEGDTEWATPTRPERPRGFGSFNPIGGAAHLRAYWMGRNHGFITGEAATEHWWE